ncbi:MAG: response regulator [Gracilimonas sp.]
MMVPKVLIVDDNAGVLFLHELMVEESGLSDNIKTFNKAETALNYLKNSSKQQPVIVFLDINMPVMNGWDFMDHVTKDDSFQHLIVVIVTSSVNKADRIKSKRYSQIIDFVEKPLTLDVCERFKKILPEHFRMEE